MKPEYLSLKSLHENLKVIANLFTRSYSPYKGAIIISKTSPSSFTLVKAGSDILQHLRTLNPINQVLYNTLKHIKDGSKTIVLLLCHMIGKLKDLESTTEKAFFYREASTFIQTFTNILMEKVEKFKLCKESQFDTIDFFMSSRFSQRTANILGSFLLAFMSVNLPAEVFEKKAFLAPCESTTKCKIISTDGFILSTKTEIKNYKNEEGFNFIILDKNSDIDNQSEQIYVNQNDTASIKEPIEFKLLYLENRKVDYLITELKQDLNVRLIVCSFELKQHIRRALKNNDILLLETIDSEEIQDLAQKTNVSILYELKDIDKSNLGVAYGVSGFEFLKNTGNHIKIILNTTYYYPVICAPNIELARMYHKNCMDCLAYLSGSGKGVIKETEFIENCINLAIEDINTKYTSFSEVFISTMNHWKNITSSSDKFVSITRQLEIVESLLNLVKIMLKIDMVLYIKK